MSRRIRSLKPELIEDEKVSPLSDAAFRLFVSLITLADDHGNVRADVRWLQGQVWWAHASPPNVLAVLAELAKASLIEPYGVRGGTYVHLRGWDKHQRIDNAGKNKVPLPNDSDALRIDIESIMDWKPSPKFSANDRESGGQSTEFAAGSGEERKGEEGIVDAAAKPPPATPSDSKRKRRLPDDWQPREEERQSARDKGLDCDAEAEHFRDYHQAKGEPHLDWDACFRTWLKNAVKFARNGRQASLPGQSTQIRKVKTL